MRAIGLGVCLGLGVFAPGVAQSRQGMFKAEARLGGIYAVEYEGQCPQSPGMHSISTPINGLEGSPEGGAINDGSRDLWQYDVAANREIAARPLATELRGSVDCRLGPPGRRPR